MDIYHCNHCSFRCSVWRKLIKHTFDCHSSLPGFQFVCCLSGCTRTFKTYSAISSHINRDHTSLERPVLTSSPTLDPTLTDDDATAVITTAPTTHILTSDGADTCMHETDNAFLPHIDDFMESEHDSMDVETDEERSILQIQKAAARFLLTLKEQHRLTQVAINFLVSQVKEIIECIVKDVKSMVSEVLVEHSFVSSNDDLQCFTKCYENTNPFIGLETEYRQKFYKTHFNLVVSSYYNYINFCQLSSIAISLFQYRNQLP